MPRREHCDMLTTSDTQTLASRPLRFVPSPMPYERRRCPRRELATTAQAVNFMVPSGYQLLRLALCDISDTGFRASASQPIAPGTPLRVRVMPGSPLYQATVVRCRPSADGYEIGCRIAHPIAA